MLAYVTRRLWQTIPTLLGVVLLVFFLFTWVGGDPAYLLAGKISNPEQIENIRRQLGVDRPYYVQLWIFIQQIATGDFGESWATNEKVSAIFATRLGPSLTVLVPLLVIDTLLAIAAAMLVAYVRGSLTDRMVMIGCTVGQSISILVYIIVFQYVLAYQLGWFPVQGWGNGFAENLLKYSLLPIITNVMIQLPGLLAGAFLIERFFSIPGIGREVILAVERSDFPVIKAVTIYVAIATMIINLIADLLYRVVDPRVQLK